MGQVKICGVPEETIKKLATDFQSKRTMFNGRLGDSTPNDTVNKGIGC
ncbi:Uncharacterised protein [Mannheimia haemolytica]|uniref:Uncharacterized protein n=1 Tax=Mannheimia haemolytica TaxID=75985 RepID=A0A378N5U3_MANHA|nr:Uncharacterised protein [Mannheimia haemolytica]